MMTDLAALSALPQGHDHVVMGVISITKPKVPSGKFSEGKQTSL